MAIDQINQEVFNIWEKHCNPCDDILVPLMYYPPLKTGGLLFMGCHIGNIDGRSVPIFLVSMLSGQRALDVYSYQRLKWHIKRVLNHI